MYTSSLGRRGQQGHVAAPASGGTWPVAAPDSGDTRSAGCCKTADFQRSEAGLGGSSPGLVGSIPAASPAQVAGDLLPGYHGPPQPPNKNILSPHTHDLMCADLSSFVPLGSSFDHVHEIRSNL